MYQVQARVTGNPSKGFESNGIDLPTFYVDAQSQEEAASKATDVINPPTATPREIRSMTLMRMTDWYGIDIRTEREKEEEEQAQDNRSEYEKEQALNRGVAILSRRFGALLNMPQPPK